ncbi:MAG: hypothetical protein U5N55_09440 [Cypionkella sp.]|nr:hypothetical protein [Cypionkella sp.]
MSARALFAVTGADRLTFLQGLLTNDVLGLTDHGITYAALLTPQGKYLADMFVVASCKAVICCLDRSLAALPRKWCSAC